MPRKHRRRGRSHWGSNDPAGPGRRRLRYWADLHDGRGYVRHSKTISGTAEDGWLELDRLHLAHSEDRPCPTLRQAYETWWLPDLMDRYERGEASKSTVANYRSRWERHVDPSFGGSTVGDIRPLDIQTWLLSGMTATMASASLRLLRQILDMCVRYEIIDHNPADGRYRMPHGVERAHNKSVLTLDETVRAVEAARGTVAYIPAVLCGMASCRPGEALGPLRAEVHEIVSGGMTLAVVDLTRQVDESGEVIEGLKTDKSARPVVVPEPWSRDVLAVDTEWLCDNGLGDPVSRWSVREAWLEALSRAGLPPTPLRNLRNSWRTYMRWELGVAEDMLEAMMGHVGRNVGEIHYDRPQAEVFAATVADAWMRYRVDE